MAKIDRRRITTVLTTDPHFEIILGAAALIDPHLDQLSDTGLI